MWLCLWVIGTISFWLYYNAVNNFFRISLVSSAFFAFDFGFVNKIGLAAH